MKIKTGQIYKHFKGSYYKIVAIAKHTETEECMVVYSNIDDGNVWVRPYNMFIEKVDKEKYPW